MAFSILFFFNIQSAISQTVVNSSNWIKLNVLSVDAHDYPKVVVSFKAKTANGAPVSGITKNEIQLMEDGKSIKVANLRSVMVLQPIYLSIVVDHSGSMEEDADKLYDKSGKPLYTVDANDKMIAPEGYISPLENAKSAIKQFVSGFNTQKDFISLTGFGSEVDKSLPITQDQKRITDALDLMKPEGKTALYDAMIRGIEEVKQAKGIKALVVITDGQDNRSTYNWKEVINSATKNNIPVYIIGLGDADKTILEQVADVTKGQFFYANSSSSFKAIYTSISQKVQSVYQIEYTSPNLNSTSISRSISLYAAIQNATVVESWATFVLPSKITTPSILAASNNNIEEKTDNESLLPLESDKYSDNQVFMPRKTADNSYLIYGNISVAVLATIATAVQVKRRIQKSSLKQQFS